MIRTVKENLTDNDKRSCEVVLNDGNSLICYEVQGKFMPAYPGLITSFRISDCGRKIYYKQWWSGDKEKEFVLPAYSKTLSTT